MGKAGVAPELVEAIARRVVELLRAEVPTAIPSRLVDAATLAGELGVERDWVYAHAEQLGAIRLGGPQGRLRFDREAVREQLAGMGSRQLRRASSRGGERSKPKRPPRHPEVRSLQKQRRAGGDAPAPRLSDNTGR